MKNKKTKNICACGRKCVYYDSKGKPKTDTKHTMCQRCYRDYRNKIMPKWKRRRKNNEHQ